MMYQVGTGAEISIERVSETDWQVLMVSHGRVIGGSVQSSYEDAGVDEHLRLVLRKLLSDACGYELECDDFIYGETVAQWAYHYDEDLMSLQSEVVFS